MRRSFVFCAAAVVWSAAAGTLPARAAVDFDAITYNTPHEHNPTYQYLRPAWGVEVSGTPNAFGGDALVPAMGGHSAYGVTLGFEYQPPFIQSLGVLGFGPSLGIYPISADAGITAHPTSLWEVGGRVRYQARFFREQPIVPEAGYAVERLAYHFSGNASASGALALSGPFFGVQLLLNVLEPSFATDAYLTNGVLRSYLFAEVRNLSGSDPNLDIKGSTYFFGLRIEF